MKKIIALMALWSVCAIAQPNYDTAINKVWQSVQKHRLTTLPKECVLFFPDDKPNKIVIEIREKHNQQCGGDINTAPLLFTYEIDKTTGKMRTDEPIWTGEYRDID